MIYLSKIKESWIVDRIRKEWYKNNKDISTKKISNSKVIWLIAPWVWQNISENYLKQKQVVCSIYHIAEDKFDNEEKKNFYDRDKYVDAYHTISEPSYEQLKNLTDKPIYNIPLWVNQKIWFEIEKKQELRKKFRLSEDDYLVGSFQRDTEGHDLISPKLEKGPDIFVNCIKELSKKNKNLKVVLTGKRRQYIINELIKLKISYVYFEMVNYKKLNQLYNVLDLYIVSSRTEGGPQAIVECGITNTPIVSTDVGIASSILHKSSIYSDQNFLDAKPNVTHAFSNSSKLTIPNGMKMYRSMFEDMYEN